MPFRPAKSFPAKRLPSGYPPLEISIFRIIARNRTRGYFQKRIARKGERETDQIPLFPEKDRQKEREGAKNP